MDQRITIVAFILIMVNPILATLIVDNKFRCPDGYFNDCFLPDPLSCMCLPDAIKAENKFSGDDWYVPIQRTISTLNEQEDDDFAFLLKNRTDAKESETNETSTSASEEDICKQNYYLYCLPDSANVCVCIINEEKKIKKRSVSRAERIRRGI